MERSKEYYINNSTVKIVFGNILDSQAEVIVNSSGSKMTMGGGLTKAIREAGGEVIREDAQTKLPVNVGDAVVTTAGRLRQKYVFHCITIDKSHDHSNTPDGISEDDIHQCAAAHIKPEHGVIVKIRGVFAVGQCGDETALLKSRRNGCEDGKLASQSVVRIRQYPCKHDAEHDVQQLHHAVVHHAPHQTFCSLLFQRGFHNQLQI